MSKQSNAGIKKSFPKYKLQRTLKQHALWRETDGKKGKRADLFFTYLSGVDLYGADLYGANLAFADLSYANLSGADLPGANLSGADLSGADLQGANLFGANLRTVNLTGANLTETIYENDIPVIINTEYYNVVKCKQYIQIGCKKYTPAEWKKLKLKDIKEIDGDRALAFNKKYRKLLLG